MAPGTRYSTSVNVKYDTYNKKGMVLCQANIVVTMMNCIAIMVGLDVVIVVAPSKYLAIPTTNRYKVQYYIKGKYSTNNT